MQDLPVPVVCASMCFDETCLYFKELSCVFVREVEQKYMKVNLVKKTIKSKLKITPSKICYNNTMIKITLGIFRW